MQTLCTGWVRPHEPVTLKPEDGGTPGTSHGICPACQSTMDEELLRREAVAASLVTKPGWFTRRLARERTRIARLIRPPRPRFTGFDWSRADRLVPTGDAGRHKLVSEKLKEGSHDQ